MQNAGPMRLHAVVGCQRWRSLVLCTMAVSDGDRLHYDAATMHDFHKSDWNRLCEAMEIASAGSQQWRSLALQCRYNVLLLQ